ncbi:hypothetical protein JTE90_028879, partial [Oedothorax gibbosus]
ISVWSWRQGRKTMTDLGFHEDTDRCCRAHDKCDGHLRWPREPRTTSPTSRPSRVSIEPKV